MKHLDPIPFAIIIICLFSFTGQKEFSLNNLDVPPGTIKIGNNLYIDKWEIRNLDYLEFLHWNKKIYGINSQEYLEILPDTTVWNELGEQYKKFKNLYLRNPAYRNFPIVGLSYFQAGKFVKWRSDRVMEFILIRDKVIKYNKNPTKDSVFTIAGYKAGKYGKVSKLEEHQFYPHYELPDSLTYIHSLPFADSVNNYSLLHSKKRKNIAEIIKPYYKENLKGKNDTLPFGEIPFNNSKISNYQIFFNSKLILDLKGNAAELTSVQGICFGGSYMDSYVFANKNLFSLNKGVNCYTGFRNSCRYKKLSDL